MTNEMLDLFVQIDATEQAQQQAEIEERRKPQTCDHCGDTMPNQVLLDINHSKYFNGWCGRRFWANKQAGWRPEQAQWLAEHGFEVEDPWSVQE
jgi:hypothetical protein